LRRPGGAWVKERKRIEEARRCTGEGEEEDEGPPGGAQGLVDPAAMARLALAEALTNLVWAAASGLADVKASVNWMYAAKMDAEGAAMYDAAAALRDAMLALGLACDGGKDSLSMAAAAGGETVKVPPALPWDPDPGPGPRAILLVPACAWLELGRCLQGRQGVLPSTAGRDRWQPPGRSAGRRGRWAPRGAPWGVGGGWGRAPPPPPPPRGCIPQPMHDAAAFCRACSRLVRRRAAPPRGLRARRAPSRRAAAARRAGAREPGGVGVRGLPGHHADGDARPQAAGRGAPGARRPDRRPPPAGRLRARARLRPGAPARASRPFLRPGGAMRCSLRALLIVAERLTYPSCTGVSDCVSV